MKYARFCGNDKLRRTKVASRRLSWLQQQSSHAFFMAWRNYYSYVQILTEVFINNTVLLKDKGIFKLVFIISFIPLPESYN